MSRARTRPRSGLGLNELLDRGQPLLLTKIPRPETSVELTIALYEMLNPETECRRSSRHGVCGEAQIPGNDGARTTEICLTLVDRHLLLDRSNA